MASKLTICCFPLPSTTPEGYRVIFVTLLDNEPSHYVMADAIKLISMVTELSLYTAGTSPGYVIITDTEGVVFGHLARMSPMMAKKFLCYVQEAISKRLKSIHYMNSVPFIDMFVNIAKPFMKKELMDMDCTNYSPYNYMKPKTDLSQ